MKQHWKFFWIMSLILIGCSAKAAPSQTMLSQPPSTSVNGASVLRASNVCINGGVNGVTCAEGHQTLIYNDTGHPITITVQADFAGGGEPYLGYNGAVNYDNPQIPLGNVAASCLTSSPSTYYSTSGNNQYIAHQVVQTSGSLPPCTLQDQQYIEVDNVVNTYASNGNQYDSDDYAHIEGLNGSILMPIVRAGSYARASYAFGTVYSPLFTSNQYPSSYPNLAYLIGAQCFGEFFLSAYTPPADANTPYQLNCPAGFTPMGGPGNGDGTVPSGAPTGNLCVRAVSASNVGTCSENLDTWEVMVTGNTINNYRSVP